MKQKELQLELVISGDGSSLYGDSEGEWLIEDVELFLGSNNYGSLYVYGPYLSWQHYTDLLIEKEIKEKLKPLLEENFSISIKELNWSEQGMQPQNGWNFDIIYKKLCCEELYASA